MLKIDIRQGNVVVVPGKHIKRKKKKYSDKTGTSSPGFPSRDIGQ